MIYNLLFKRSKKCNCQLSIVNCQCGKGFIQHHRFVLGDLFKHRQKINEKDQDSTAYRYGAGFTLIELLIVISIIGILASLLMVNFIGIRQRARDAQRKTDVRQIQAALEMYRSDEGVYPTSSIFACNSGASFGSSDCSNIYMQEEPMDPLGASSGNYNNGHYCIDSEDGSTYYIVACLENKSDQQGVASAVDACTDAVKCTTYYMVKNP
jgi:type II secretion system protein G